MIERVHATVCAQNWELFSLPSRQTGSSTIPSSATLGTSVHHAHSPLSLWEATECQGRVGRSACALPPLLSDSGNTRCGNTNGDGSQSLLNTSRGTATSADRATCLPTWGHGVARLVPACRRALRQGDDLEQEHCAAEVARVRSAASAQHRCRGGNWWGALFTAIPLADLAAQRAAGRADFRTGRTRRSAAEEGARAKAGGR